MKFVCACMSCAFGVRRTSCPHVGTASPCEMGKLCRLLACVADFEDSRFARSSVHNLCGMLEHTAFKLMARRLAKMTLVIELGCLAVLFFSLCWMPGPMPPGWYHTLHVRRLISLYCIC